MRTVEISRGEWRRTFDAFSQVYGGWLVSLDIVMPPPAGTQEEFHLMPLVGITAEPFDGGAVTISAAAPTGAQITHTIHSPTHIFVEKTGTGANAAVTVDSADGAKAVLRLRANTLRRQ